MAGKSNFVRRVTTIFKEKDIDVPISMFKVPSSLTSAKPEAYVPQQLGLGPVHHLRRELQHMQMYKLVEAKRIHNGFQSGLELDHVIEFLKQMVASSVCASYNIFLDIEDDVLACVIAVDGLFLFNLLCCYGISKKALANTSTLCRLVNSSERRLAKETTIQEAMMLENQIPIFALKVILILECWKVDQVKEIVSDLFPKILLGFCESVSPFKIVANIPPLKALKHAHLLDLLYHLVTLKHSPADWNDKEDEEELKSIDELSEKVRNEIFESVFPIRRKMQSKYVDKMIEIGKKLAPLQFQKPIELVEGLLGLPWSDLTSSIQSATEEEVPEKEIFIPRASDLHKAGVKFSVADHITDIDFKRRNITVSFHLPFIRINANSEVITRNLVVYEAMINSEKEPRILNWYVELMNGLIQTAEDVKVLKDQGIISKSESIDDEKIAKIFGGMNKAAELTNIPNNLDNAVSSVKKYYDDVWWVSMFKSMNKCWRCVSKWGKVVAVLLVLFFMAVQSFCAVYECRRFSFKINNTCQDQLGLQLPSLRSHLM